MDDGDSDYYWYFENVVVGGRPANPGPAERRQLAWRRIADGLRGTSDVADLALGQGFVVTSRQARACGVSSANSRRLVRRGEWTAPRYGTLSVVGAGTDDQPHGLAPEIRAGAAALVTGTVIGHECAASAYGLPLLRQPDRARVTTAPRIGCGRATALLRPAALEPVDCSTWFGAPITGIARTAVDLARHDIRQGLVAADAALHEQLCTSDELMGAAARASGWPGVRGARRVLELASGLIESPLESLSRLLIDDAGLPLPQPQEWVTTRWRRYRVDGLWKERAVVLEADGMLKYTSGGSVQSALEEEKRRQEHLERSGYRVVRVTWHDVMFDRDETVRRISWALRAGGRRVATSVAT